MLSRLLILISLIAVCLGGSNDAQDPYNANFRAEGTTYHLLDGGSEVQAAPDSSTKIRTFLHGKPVSGDVDGDGDIDYAVVPIHQPAGSGTFYYVAAIFSNEIQPDTIEAVLVGDRIRIKQLTLRNNYLRIDYLNRRSEEAMALEPTEERVA
jgi:hypothetical protein